MLTPQAKPSKSFFEAISKMGYKAVEYWTCPDELEEIYELCQTFGLSISIITGHGDIAHGMNDLEEHPRILKELENHIKIAAKYHIHGLICFSGNKIPGQSSAVSISNCIRCLKEIAPLAEENNVLLNMELLNTLIDHPGYECDHTSWGVEIIKGVESSHVKLLYDIYHMQIMEGNLINNINQNLEYIGHFHTAGVPGRYDLDDDQEINYKAICKNLSERNFPHFLGHEFRPKKNPINSLKHAFEICNQ